LKFKVKAVFKSDSPAGYIARAGIIAAIYIVVTLLIKPIAYGPIQFRIPEALTILAFIDPAAILGLTVGVFFANFASPLGLVDILGGSALTLLAALLTFKIKNKYLAMLPPIVVNALGVPLYLAPAYDLPYWPTVGYIAFGQAVVIGILGLPVLELYKKAAGTFVKKA
jgi:uncharacterized membrane protein